MKEKFYHVPLRKMKQIVEDLIFYLLLCLSYKRCHGRFKRFFAARNTGEHHSLKIEPGPFPSHHVFSRLSILENVTKWSLFSKGQKRRTHYSSSRSSLFSYTILSGISSVVWRGSLVNPRRSITHAAVDRALNIQAFLLMGKSKYWGLFYSPVFFGTFSIFSSLVSDMSFCLTCAR